MNHESSYLKPACGTSNYWKQKAIGFGHDARLISAKVSGGGEAESKTDKNDALGACWT